MLRTSDLENIQQMNNKIRNTQRPFSEEPWEWLHFFYTFMHCINFPLTWAFALFQFCQPCSQYYTHEKTEAYRLYSESLTHLNMMFTVLFSIECILKLMAFGPKVWSCLEAQYPVDLILSDFTIFFWFLFASLMLFSCLSFSWITLFSWSLLWLCVWSSPFPCILLLFPTSCQLNLQNLVFTRGSVSPVSFSTCRHVSTFVAKYFCQYW